MTDTSEARRRRQSGRSPSYPAISLPTAIDRARVLYGHERQFATPVASIVKHWGYSTLNGPAGLALAALKKYGLVTDEGSKDERRVKISDLAVRILEHPNAETRQEAIRDAALKPTIHREMWTEFGEELPSDSTLIWTLSKERGFTENGAREFVKEYRETLAFANLVASDADPADVAPEDDLDDEVSPAAEPDLVVKPYSPGDVLSTYYEVKRPNSRLQTYTVPIGIGENVIVQGEFPITMAKWNQFIAVLNAMRPGLIAEPESSESDPS